MNDELSKSQTPPSSVQGMRAEPRREIIEYLRSHPEAADTVDGILDWWIPTQLYENAKYEIQQVLREMVAQGLIEDVLLGNEHRLYRLPNPKKKSP
jgi:hypothetical protein